jgi:hypothetical protein
MEIIISIARGKVVGVEIGGSEKDEDFGRAEVKGKGVVGLKPMWDFLRLGTSLCTLTLLIFGNLLGQVLTSGSDYFLQLWYV